MLYFTGCRQFYEFNLVCIPKQLLKPWFYLVCLQISNLLFKWTPFGDYSFTLEAWYLISDKKVYSSHQGWSSEGHSSLLCQVKIILLHCTSWLSFCSYACLLSFVHPNDFKGLCTWVKLSMCMNMLRIQATLVSLWKPSVFVYLQLLRVSHHPI